MIDCKHRLLAFRDVDCYCIVYDTAIIIDSNSVIKELRNLNVFRRTNFFQVIIYDFNI